MSQTELEDTINAAYEDRNDIGPTTQGPVRPAVETALALLDRGVVRARQQKPARRIDPDLCNQLIERHELAGALGHLRALAAAQQMHELHDQQLELVGIPAESGIGGLLARRSRPLLAHVSRQPSGVIWLDWVR